MKIRRKDNHDDVREVGEVNPTTARGLAQMFGRWVVDYADKAVFYKDSDWEPVPTERWKDVTQDCHYVEPRGGERGGISHSGPGNAVCQMYDGYRLRKVGIWGGENPAYFIVEQRTEEP